MTGYLINLKNWNFGFLIFGQKSLIKMTLENFMQKFNSLLHFKDKGFYHILFVTIHTNHGLIMELHR